MSVFKKILVPLDASECSFNALEKSVHIAKKILFRNDFDKYLFNKRI